MKINTIESSQSEGKNEFEKKKKEIKKINLSLSYLITCFNGLRNGNEHILFTSCSLTKSIAQCFQNATIKGHYQTKILMIMNVKVKDEKSRHTLDLLKNKLFYFIISFGISPPSIFLFKKLNLFDVI